MSSSQNEVVPYINIRSPRLQPGKFVIGETKRLLQHYLHFSDIPVASVNVRLRGQERTSDTWPFMSGYDLSGNRRCMRTAAAGECNRHRSGTQEDRPAAFRLAVKAMDRSVSSC